ncbi:MAG: helix-turn-helix domain-containing protein [Clostridium sp.]|nr:MAG: helix-turn-helix domain-containing protein [Clostridium sp.]
MAGELFVSPKTISRWESGLGIPDINIISSVADFYGVTVDEILKGEKE